MGIRGSYFQVRLQPEARASQNSKQTRIGSGCAFIMSKILPGGKEEAAQDILTSIYTNDGSKQRNWGLLVTSIIGGTLVALYSVATPFIAPALRKHCLPFVPATSKQIENVLNMLKGRNGSLVDIGSGDGRIVIAAAKVGFKAVGYELNPWLVWYSRYCAWREGVHQDAKFYISDLWKMLQLEKKLGEELRLDARVIACRFPFPHWRPNYNFGEGIDTVWAYDSESFRMRIRK
ncbi:ATP synthase subunit C lysine N-methyltransferase isoform X2 [Rhineura floridana]|uniref:ATP synthase subunit C lysine N-methyltransferase isoform X2 n=1 Tax=Rhineura floridana TaxID=261503 RepID=UPI002AC86A89|nr:ATP synthase subunit C lysine N-methyltransferase isoform X2 [Rhineura floridana]